MSISIISLNARGLRDITKRKALFLYAKSFKTDFCFFQESHSVASDAAFWKNQWNNDVWMAHGSERSAGVLTLKNLFAGDVLHYFSDPNGHFLLMDKHCSRDALLAGLKLEEQTQGSNTNTSKSPPAAVSSPPPAPRPQNHLSVLALSSMEVFTRLAKCLYELTRSLQA
ncbi:hypothetical protein E1301_Tti011443 [Triplophysa tibetana]|uniref:Uncharacterized protein n=1 Tax=Triplophysa tibetana TaxID=1572043 RepID=A0A5A9PEH2_9TELE|nr:hypothetical protein E1301_Tti011443 [Triplophysa tibetana]